MLSDDILARRDRLPIKPDPVTLRGELVEMRPLDLDDDLDALHAVSSGAPCKLGDRAMPAYDPDARVWRYMSGGPFANASELRAWLAPQLALPDALALTVRIAGAPAKGSTDRPELLGPVGVACFIANQPQHLKIELGSIWYGPIAQGTGASAEATYLMLEHAFALGYRRLEWKCDSRNEPSRRAALAYGFSFEGIQQAHYIIKRDNRDTAWFRMLDDEWPAIRPRLADYVRSRSSSSRSSERDDDVAQVQEVDHEVRGDRPAEVARLHRELAERDAERERRCGPRQEPLARPDVEQREHDRLPPHPHPRQQRAAEQHLLADRAREREDQDLSRRERAEQVAKARVELARPAKSARRGARQRDDREPDRAAEQRSGDQEPRDLRPQPVQIRVASPRRDDQRHQRHRTVEADDQARPRQRRRWRLVVRHFCETATAGPAKSNAA
jgi:RimJ/RimL family protein N-acetyltransferase